MRLLAIGLPAMRFTTSGAVCGRGDAALHGSTVLHRRWDDALGLGLTVAAARSGTARSTRRHHRHSAAHPPPRSRARIGCTGGHRDLLDAAGYVPADGVGGGPRFPAGMVASASPAPAPPAAPPAPIAAPPAPSASPRASAGSYQPRPTPWPALPSAARQLRSDLGDLLHRLTDPLGEGAEDAAECLHRLLRHLLEVPMSCSSCLLPSWSAAGNCVIASPVFSPRLACPASAAARSVGSPAFPARPSVASS